jgi:ATP-dependent Lon protease
MVPSKREVGAMRSDSSSRSAECLVAEYRERIDRSDIPEHIRPELERHLRRLMRLGRQRPEFRFTLAYLEWMLQLPWKLRSRAEDLFARTGAAPVRS